MGIGKFIAFRWTRETIKAHIICRSEQQRMPLGSCAPDNSYLEGKPFTKLKKDGIPGHDETTDLSIIGGRSNADNKRGPGVGRLWWTGFASGPSTMRGIDEVCPSGGKRHFRLFACSLIGA